MSGGTVHLPGEGENYEMGASRVSLKATERETVIEGSPGTFVCAPPETPHTFSNPGSEPVRFLNFNLPGGFEHYMRELVGAWQAAGGPPEPATLGAIASSYDIEVVAAPPG